MQTRRRHSYCYLPAVLAVLTLLFWNRAAVAVQKPFDLPAAEASRAIPEFARQAGVQIFAPTEKLKNLRLPAVHGVYEVREALTILLEGTGLTIAADDGWFITLREASTPA